MPCRLKRWSRAPNDFGDRHPFASKERDFARKKCSVILPSKFKPLIRPTFGLYTGTTAPPKSASAGLTLIISQVQVVEQSLGVGNCDFAPELENTRYTTWAKSVAHSTHSLILGSSSWACRMITAAVNDLDGSVAGRGTDNSTAVSQRPPAHGGDRYVECKKLAGAGAGRLK